MSRSVGLRPTSGDGGNRTHAWFPSWHDGRSHHTGTAASCLQIRGSPLLDSNRRPVRYHGSPASSRNARRQQKDLQIRRNGVTAVVGTVAQRSAPALPTEYPGSPDKRGIHGNARRRRANRVAIGVGVFDGVTAAHGLVAAVLAARARRQALCRAHLELLAAVGALCRCRTRHRFRRGQDLPSVVPFEGISEHYPALRSVCHSALTQSGSVSSPSGPSVLRAGSRVRRRGRPARAGGCVRVRR